MTWLGEDRLEEIGDVGTEVIGRGELLEALGTDDRRRDTVEAIAALDASCLSLSWEAGRRIYEESVEPLDN